MYASGGDPPGSGRRGREHRLNGPGALITRRDSVGVSVGLTREEHRRTLMAVQIKAKDYKVSDALRDYVQERIDKLDRFIGRGASAKLELAREHNRTGGDQMVAQLTIA